MFGILQSIGELAADTAKLVAAPVKATVDLTDAVVKPVAEFAGDLADQVAKLKDRE
jgi:hypothetical protein